jgi:hypothetical protein
MNKTEVQDEIFSAFSDCTVQEMEQFLRTDIVKSLVEARLSGEMSKIAFLRGLRNAKRLRELLG